MKLKIIYLFASLLLIGCKTSKFEENFFSDFEGDATARMRNYSLEDQYKIVRYGFDKMEPPLLELADPIALKGREAVPFLTAKLNATADDITVRDILTIFGRMKAYGTFSAKTDSSLMRLLTLKVQNMKDREWKAVCLGILQRV